LSQQQATEFKFGYGNWFKLRYSNSSELKFGYGSLFKCGYSNSFELDFRHWLELGFCDSLESGSGNELDYGNELGFGN